MPRATIDVIRDPLRAIGERRVIEVAHFIAGGHPHGSRPGGGLNDVEKRQAGVLRRAPDHRQVEEITLVVALHRELVVIVADEAGLHDVHVLAQMLAVGGDGVAFGAKLIVARIGGEQVDVGQMGRIAFAQIGDELAQRRKVRRAGLVGDEIIVKRRVMANAGDQRIQLLALRGILQRGRREQAVGELGAQAVPLRHIQFLLPAPDQVEAALGHLGRGGVGHGRPAPVGDDGRAHLPGGRRRRSGGRARGINRKQHSDQSASQMKRVHGNCDNRVRIIFVVRAIVH